MTQRDDTLAWIDMEMTGLDPDSCAIVQVALIITDHQLQELAPPLELTVWQPPSVLENMSPFVREMHRKSGLLDQISKSELDLKDAERELMDLLTRYATYKTARLAGNSVWQDRRFIAKYMPALDDYLHYRIVDVSTLKELAGWWYNVRHEKPSEGAHTALFDIRQSIDELRFYRDQILRTPG